MISPFARLLLVTAGLFVGANPLNLLPAEGTFKNARSPSNAQFHELEFYDSGPVLTTYTIKKLFAENKCDSTAEENGYVPVHFSGAATWEMKRLPESLPAPTFMTIQVQDASQENVANRSVYYVHSQEISKDYAPGKPIAFSFCAKVPQDTGFLGLYARIVVSEYEDSSSNNQAGVERYAGLTEVESGLREYVRLRVRMYKASLPVQLEVAESDDASATMSHDELTGSAAACNFSADDESSSRGVATRVMLALPHALMSTAKLPNPTFLTVRIEDAQKQLVNANVFSSDVTSQYNPPKPLTAVVCARLPVQAEPAEYTVHSILHVGSA